MISKLGIGIANSIFRLALSTFWKRDLHIQCTPAVYIYTYIIHSRNQQPGSCTCAQDCTAGCRRACRSCPAAPALLPLRHLSCATMADATCLWPCRMAQSMKWQPSSSSRNSAFIDMSRIVAGVWPARAARWIAVSWWLYDGDAQRSKTYIKRLGLLLFYIIATVFQLYLGGDMMYEMSWTKPEPTHSPVVH